MVVTGTKSESLCRLACCHFAKLIKKYHHDPISEGFRPNADKFVFTKKKSIKIENIVAKVDLEKEINLEYFGHKKIITKIDNKQKEEWKDVIQVEFVPETFPGVIWRDVEGAVNKYHLTKKKFTEQTNKVKLQSETELNQAKGKVKVNDSKLATKNNVLKSEEKEVDKSKMVILIFKSGKIIFTGGKSETEIKNSLELLQI